MDFNKPFNALFTPFALSVFMFVFVLLFGLRSVEVGADTSMYHYIYNNIEGTDFGMDKLFEYTLIFLNLITDDPQIFIFLMSALFLIILSKMLDLNAKMLSSNKFLIFFVFISLFFFQTISINIIRQGISLSFLLLAVTLYHYRKGNNFIWILCIVISILFHTTSIIPLAIYLIANCFKAVKLRFFYCFYVFCIILALTSVSILSFQAYIGFLLIDEKRSSSYLTDSHVIYNIGFKPQFVLFNTLFLLIFYFIRKHISSTMYYDRLLKYYLAMSAIFFLTFQIPYSDRWGLMSWIIIPILISPIFNYKFPYKVSVAATLVLLIIFVFFENYT